MIDHNSLQAWHLDHAWMGDCMAGRLSDDGTMDTVIVCDACGQKARYNYDGADRDSADFEAKVEDNMRDLKLTRQQAEDDIARLDYYGFVKWAIEDFNDSHECAAKRWRPS